MSTFFAFECFADEDVFLFLRDECRLPIIALHQYGQGEVVNAVLVKKRAAIGMVDEDPLSSHHRLRDQMQVLESTAFLELRKTQDRHLIVVKPRLEECFLSSMRRVGLTTQLPSQPDALHRVLNIEEHPHHQLFRTELKKLYEASRTRRAQAFITDLEVLLRKVLP